jgi:diguanylate cyclase (GGDEF)-like protein
LAQPGAPDTAGRTARRSKHAFVRRLATSLAAIVILASTTGVGLGLTGWSPIGIHGAILLTLLAVTVAGLLPGIDRRLSKPSGRPTQATRDPLTGLALRSEFQQAVADWLSRSRHSAPQSRPLMAVIHLDIDRFALINDSLGHATGDAVLRVVAERVRLMTPSDGLVARIDGDEFAVLLPKVVDLWAAIRSTERLNEEIQGVISLGGHNIVMTASIGLALGTPGIDRAETLFRQASIALHEAKRGGTARHVVYHPSMMPATTQRLDLESGLRRALADQQLDVAYQPVIDLTSGRIVEVEALVRWPHSSRGLLLPSEFIPLAEETGLIVPLGQLVLQRACRCVQAWQQAQPHQPPLLLGVNLSAREFQQPGLVAQIARTLGASGLDPRRLKLEITETVALLDEDATLYTLNELRLLGVHLALDDFGTGYSALRCLKRFPLDCLKIDRSFVAGISTSAGDLAIVQAIIAFAAQLGLRVTAEGIETQAQLDLLRQLGCHLGQGFLIAPPAPWPHTAKLLAAQASLALDQFGSRSALGDRYSL